MIHLNYLSIVTAAVAVFIFAAIYYVVLARQRAALSAAAAGEMDAGHRPSPALMGIEVLKSLFLATVMAGLVTLLGITSISGGLALGLVLWLAFPVVLLTGSVMYENVPWKLGAIHSGDWLAKLLIISVIVTAWR